MFSQSENTLVIVPLRLALTRYSNTIYFSNMSEELLLQYDNIKLWSAFFKF